MYHTGEGSGRRGAGADTGGSGADPGCSGAGAGEHARRDCVREPRSAVVGCGYDADLARGSVGVGAGGEGVRGRDQSDKKVGPSRAGKGGPVLEFSYHEPMYANH